MEKTPVCGKLISVSYGDACHGAMLAQITRLYVDWLMKMVSPVPNVLLSLRTMVQDLLVRYLWFLYRM